jgi:hypothetical protein
MARLVRSVLLTLAVSVLGGLTSPEFASAAAPVVTHTAATRPTDQPAQAPAATHDGSGSPVVDIATRSERPDVRSRQTPLAVIAEAVDTEATPVSEAVPSAPLHGASGWTANSNSRAPPGSTASTST